MEKVLDVIAGCVLSYLESLPPETPEQKAELDLWEQGIPTSDRAFRPSHRKRMK